MQKCYCCYSERITRDVITLFDYFFIKSLQPRARFKPVLTVFIYYYYYLFMCTLCPIMKTGFKCILQSIYHHLKMKNNTEIILSIFNFYYQYKELCLFCDSMHMVINNRN